MYVIRPFRAQGADELALALAVRSWAPALATLAAAAALILAIALWRRRSRVYAVLLSSLTLVAAGLTHINVFEKMFYRIDNVESVAAADAKLDPDDMVLAVKAGGQSRAWPVRTMAYHHIANDNVGNMAVVATY